MAWIWTTRHGRTYRKEFENGGLIRTKSGKGRCRDRETLPVAKNNTSKHEKQRRSSGHRQREKHEESQLRPKREIQSADANLPVPATNLVRGSDAQEQGKTARIQVKQKIENRPRKPHRTHELGGRTPAVLSPSVPSSQALPGRRARWREHPAGRSTKRADGGGG